MNKIISLFLILISTSSLGQIDITLGTWVGEMDGKKLMIVIDQIKEGEISGYNIVGTNRRSISGSFDHSSWDQPCSISYESILSEPGDDKWDGVFFIKFVGYQNVIESEYGPECIGGFIGVEAFGEWISNNGKLNKEFYLTQNNN